MTISGAIVSTGSDFINEQFTIELYNDLDQNGVVNPGDPLLTTVLFSGNVTPQVSLPFDFEFATDSEVVCNLIFRIQTTNATVCDELFALLPPPQIQNAGQNQVFCAQENETITTIVGVPDCAGQTLYDITWIALPPAEESSISNNKLAQPTISLQYDGVGNDTFLYVIETARPNCEEVVLDTAQIVLTGAVELEDLNPITLVPGASVELAPIISSGTPPFDFEWSPSDGLDFTDIQNPTASPEETTSYQLIVSNDFGCMDTTTVLVEIVIPVNAQVNPGDTAICANSELTLVASGGEEFIWNASPDNPTDNNLDFSNGLNNPVFSGGIPGGVYVYEVIVSLTDFPQFLDTATVSIAIYEPPIVATGADTLICLGEQIQLNAVAQGGAPGYEYQWSPAPLFGQNTPNPIVQPGSTQVYTVLITDQNGCTAEDQVTVSVENCDCIPPVVNGYTRPPEAVTEHWAVPPSRWREMRRYLNIPGFPIWEFPTLLGIPG